MANIADLLAMPALRELPEPEAHGWFRLFLDAYDGELSEKLERDASVPFLLAQLFGVRIGAEVLLEAPEPKRPEVWTRLVRLVFDGHPVALVRHRETACSRETPGMPLVRHVEPGLVEQVVKDLRAVFTSRPKSCCSPEDDATPLVDFVQTPAAVGRQGAPVPEPQVTIRQGDHILGFLSHLPDGRCLVGYDEVRMLFDDVEAGISTFQAAAAGYACREGELVTLDGLEFLFPEALATLEGLSFEELFPLARPQPVRCRPQGGFLGRSATAGRFNRALAANA